MVLHLGIGSKIQIWFATAHLPAVLYEVLSHGIKVPIFGVWEKVGMVAALAELHHNVENRCATNISPVDRVNIAHQNPLVHLPLHL